MEKMGVEAITITPEEFQKKLREEAAHWTTVVRKYGIKAE
jgi:tripartite-type tricarboxylate transporter receptor subunit TctC